jgi:hypothetical protein
VKLKKSSRVLFPPKKQEETEQPFLTERRASNPVMMIPKDVKMKQKIGVTSENMQMKALQNVKSMLSFANLSVKTGPKRGNSQKASHQNSLEEREREDQQRKLLATPFFKNC